jgi:NifU-like protein
MTVAIITSHFFNPTNVGEVVNADGVGVAGSFACGATLRISLAVAEAQTISAAKFKCAGCSYLVAACSILTELVSGKTTGQAAALVCAPLSNIADLARWPPEKIQCLELASQGLLAAIRNYSDAERADWSGEDALICTCFGVTAGAIENAIELGDLSTSAEVTLASRAGGGCQSCLPLIEDILDQHAREGGI